MNSSGCVSFILFYHYFRFGVEVENKMRRERQRERKDPDFITSRIVFFHDLRPMMTDTGHRSETRHTQKQRERKNDAKIL